MNCVIGVDLGTTGCKAMVFDQDGNILGESYIEYPLIILTDREIEQNPNDWWELLKKVVFEAIMKSNVDKNTIKAISISSQGISFVPVDKDCNPLYNAFSWLDTRAGEQVKQILSEFNNDYIYRITGKRANAAYVLPKLIWLKQYQPGIYEAAYKFLMAHDFVVAKLTGEFITDHTMAGGTLMYDINTLSWSSEIIDRSGVDSEKLPDIRWPGEIAGKITRKAAVELGLGKDVLVCVGAQDQKAAALGSKLEYGKATISIGTAGAIEILVDSPVFDEKMSIPCFTYMEKGQWVLEAVVSTAGAGLKWCRNTLFPQISYNEFDCLCKETPAGSNGVFFYPHLSGATSPYWDTDARGMFYGLSLSTDRKDFARSVLEGMAFQFKTNIMKAEEMGASIQSIQIFGGGSKSSIWCNIITNVTGKKVTAFSSPEIASLGAGIFAARGAGFCTDGFGRGILESRVDYMPDRNMVNMYKEIYSRYSSIEKLFVKD